MNKKSILILSFFIISSLTFSYDYTLVDELYRVGKYKEGLEGLESNFDVSKPDSQIIWRISRFYFEIAEAIDKRDKQEKINYYTKGMDIAEPYLDIKNGDALDRAQVIFWYTACFGSRGEVIGIKESLDIVPKLFELADRSLALDPTFAAPYLLKGRIDNAVPFFLGGDKFRLGQNLSLAIKYNPDDMSVLVDSADMFISRDWDADKKRKNVEKKGADDGTPQNLSDKEYAKILLEKGIKLFDKIKNPSFRDKSKLEEAKKLLAGLK